MSTENIAFLKEKIQILTQKAFNSEEEFQKAIKEFELACMEVNNLDCIFKGRIEKPLVDDRKEWRVWIYPISIDVFTLPPDNKRLTRIEGMAYVEQAKGILETDLDPDDLKFLDL